MMRQNYGELRLWLWTCLPFLNLIGFYLTAWRVYYLENHISPGFAGGYSLRLENYAEVDQILRMLNEFHGLMLFGMFASLLVWIIMMRRYSVTMSIPATYLHNFVYITGWVVNGICLVNDPGGYIAYSFD